MERTLGLVNDLFLFELGEVGKEQKIINANKELIKICENKIKDKIADVWGE